MDKPTPAMNRSTARFVAGVPSSAGLLLVASLGLALAQAPVGASPARKAEPSRDARLAAAREVLIVDPWVPAHEALVAAARPRVEAFVLDATRDGIDQVAAILASRRGVSAVHLVAHGEPGALALGSGGLTRDELERRGDTVARWFARPSGPDARRADLLLYGCDVAKGPEGARLLERLAALTGADVAASTDATGSAANGADWILEASTGTIEASLPIAAAAAAAYSGTLATFVVTNLYDTGPGSLRQALADANATAGRDTIIFSSAACGPSCGADAGTDGTLRGTIALASRLEIRDAVTIEGPGADDLTLDGQGLTDILLVDGSIAEVDATIRGVAFHDGAGATQGGALGVVGAQVHLDGCRFTSNASTSDGGAILGALGGGRGAAIDLVDCELVGNASAGYGGAIAIKDAGSSLLVTRSTLRENDAVSGGALSVTTSSMADVVDSTLSDNDVTEYGGAFLVASGADLFVGNSTISGNEAAMRGGAFFLGGDVDVDVVHATITGNSAGEGAGFFFSTGIYGEQTSIRDSIVFGQTAGGLPELDLLNPTTFGPLVERSIVGAAAGPVRVDERVFFGVDPLLGPLAAQGGPTATHALGADSPAIDLGGNPEGFTNDQRGPGFPRVVGAAADVGAYEVQPPPSPDAGVDAGVAPLAPSADDGCGCAVVGAHPREEGSARFGVLAAVAGLVALRRRRRRRD